VRTENTDEPAPILEYRSAQTILRTEKEEKRRKKQLRKKKKGLEY
jgi:hypothetical protein